MTDKEYYKQKARVKKYWNKWYTAIGLGWWRVDLYWNRNRNEDEPRELGHTETNWQYRTGAITFNVPECAGLDDGHLEEAVVHEMTHILVGGLHDLRDDQSREITEYTVTTIARAILWARRAGKKDTKPKKS